MNRPYRDYQVPPDNIIDLKKIHSERLKTAWYDLTAVRFVRYIFSFIVSLFIMLGELTKEVLTKRRDNKIAETVKKAQKEFAVEAKTLSAPVKKHSYVFKIVNFIVLLCLIALPFLGYAGWRAMKPWRTNLFNKVEVAFSGLFQGKDLLEKENFNEAQIAFTTAGENFVAAQDSLKNINQVLFELASILPDEKIKLAAESKRILAAGKSSARLGADLAAAITPAPQSNILQTLERFNAYAIPASEEAENLSRQINKINVNNLPEEYQAQFINLKKQAELLAPGLKEAVELSKRSLVFLGKNHDKRYLLVFQNNSERRASGGFLGSFAVIDIRKGEIANLTVPKGGSYDTEAGLYKRVVAPEPLWLVNPLWHFWDANWWPDWPTTARKLEWFYEKSNGPTVDGVVGLTPTVIEKLLVVNGPVDMTKDYGVIIDANNFWQVTQTFSEQKPTVTKEPKKIIGDLMTKLLEEIPKNMNQEKLLALIDVFESSLDEKHILIYLNDPVLESSVKYFGWDGRVKDTNKDYLMVVSSNIGGQKSDRLIKETIDHQAEILPDGSIVVNLKVRREHTAPKNQQFVGFRNVNWLRVYVPSGSRLISSSGWRQPEQSYFEYPDKDWEEDPDLANERNAKTEAASGTKIYEENNKTVFANWSMVDPGETAEINLRYELPFKLENYKSNSWFDKLKRHFFNDGLAKYSLLVQKQPGSQNTNLRSSYKVNNLWQPLWHYPDELIIDNHGWALEKSLDRDIYINILLDNK